ncbi:sirohydrochlorin cobaltochelatase [Vibrio sp. SCSIO 43136]|uniref:sirohydrochlorin cobaltochelatase n=1 Tax=Vibrio sp. SCSIO 43136 TaxID=2819101 RepID=UPI0020758F1F|nr:sirohydrochlorin cobaltochelatase [Vibrio sp. SCSIO 43136]USD66873.1 sirohydrochlorin cobaltochelatase [Vibrio sp. SCSIO 43136]
MKRLRHYNQGTAIVLSCFGSVVEQQRYRRLQDHVQSQYPDTHVRIATSSKMVIKKLKKQGEACQSLPQVMADLDTQGFERILVVSVYLFPTDEHLYLTKIVDGFKQFSLSKIEQTPAIMHHSQLATNLLGALHQRFDDGESCNLFVHHGAPLLDNPGHQALSYADCLLTKLCDRNFTCSLEGAWPFSLLKPQLIKKMQTNTQSNKVKIIPLLLVSGNHFVNDMQQIKGDLDEAFDVSIAEPIQGDKFCMLDMPELEAIIDKQIREGLIRLSAPEVTNG